jgi:hypothetical protein
LEAEPPDLRYQAEPGNEIDEISVRKTTFVKEENRDE